LFCLNVNKKFKAKILLRFPRKPQNSLLGMSLSVFFGAKFHENMKNKNKHGIFCYNIPSIGKKISKFWKKKMLELFFGPHLDFDLFW